MPSETKNHATKLKVAELTSTMGVFVLGVGFGALFHQRFTAKTTTIILMGLATHAWAMYERHRLEKQSLAQQVWWEATLFWLCWFALFGLSIYLLLQKR